METEKNNKMKRQRIKSKRNFMEQMSYCTKITYIEQLDRWIQILKKKKKGESKATQTKNIKKNTCNKINN